MVDRIAWMAAWRRCSTCPRWSSRRDRSATATPTRAILERAPAGTPVIEKPTFGLAAHEAAVDAIRATARGTAVLVGFETDVCVAQSAIGLLQFGFRAVVLEDATYTNSAREHERGLARMSGTGVERNHCKGLTFEWLHTVDRALEDFPAAQALGTPPWRL